MNTRFPVINILLTDGVEELVGNSEQFEEEIDLAIKKYRNADWGNIPADVWKQNDKAVENVGGNIMARYDTSEGPVLIMTEKDFKTTTVFLPSEF